MGYQYVHLSEQQFEQYVMMAMQQVHPNQKLYQSVCDGASVREIRSLIFGSGASPNSVVSNGDTVFGKAIRNGGRDIIYTLIRAIPEYQERFPERASKLPTRLVNVVDGRMRTALHYASDQDSECEMSDVVCVLLGAGASVDLSDKESLTALHLACSRGNTESVLCLLRWGCSITLKTAPTYESFTALHIAASRGFTQIVTHLLNYGAPLEALDKKEQTPLFAAVTRGHHDTVKTLIAAGANLNARQLNGYSPLSEAVNNNDLQMTEILVASGACCLVGQNRFLLHQSIAQNLDDICHALIRSNSCDLNQLNSMGDTPLHVACRRGAVGIIRSLLHSGANPNLGNRHTQSVPLLQAVCSVECVELFETILLLLLAAGANPDVETGDFDTPLRRAILLRKTAFARLLLIHGVDIDTPRPWLNYACLFFVGDNCGIDLLRLIYLVGLKLSSDVLRPQPWMADVLQGSGLETPSAESRNAHESRRLMALLACMPRSLKDLARIEVRSVLVRKRAHTMTHQQDVDMEFPECRGTSCFGSPATSGEVALLGAAIDKLALPDSVKLWLKFEDVF